MNKKSILSALLACVFTGAGAVGSNDDTLIINEIMSANVDQFFSPSVNFDGWIELYNPTDQVVSLGGLYFSDDESNLKKWKAPSLMGNIPAKGFKTVWFDNNELAKTNVPFKLDLDGGTIYISDASGNLLTSQTFPEAIERVAYARTTDGGDDWQLTADPTPGATNTTSKFASDPIDAPQVSQPDQLFENSFVVRVDIPEGCTLRYTTDGSLPTLTNGFTISTGLFNVRNTTCYRFRLFAEGRLPSPVVTRSYIKKDRDYTGHIVSVVADPDFLYGNEHGVMVRGTNGKPGHGQSGKCNWNMDWDRPVNFAYMLPGGVSAVNRDVDLEMCGGWSRAWEPHSFKLKGQKEYGGNKNLDYPFFAEKPYIRNRTLQVRNGGNDNWNRFKDPALETIILTSGIDLDVQSYLPVHEFINGEYIGMLNLREPNNKHYIYANYGWDDDEIDQFEMDPDSAYVQKCGTKESFNELYNLCKNASIDNNYEQIKQCLDIDEYINYMAMEMYLGSTDWPQNNLKGFKRRPDGKFRFISFDLDFAFNTSNSFTDFSNKRTHQFDWLYDKQTNITAEIEMVTIFVRLLTNKNFRRQFIDTYCIMGGSVFEPTRSAQVIDSLANRAYPLQHLEWGTPWNMADELKNNLSKRMSIMTNTLKNYSPMGLTNTTPRRGVLRSNVKSAAIYVNDTKVPTGYFDGNLFAPVKIKAVAPAGYNFKGWVNTKSQQKTVFGRKESWIYYDKGNIGTNNWMAEDYVTTGWKTGYAPLGYGKSDLNTTIGYGNNSDNKYPTYYFRKLVTLDETLSDDAAFTLEFTVDDGFIIYVNGKEAGRYNMPSGNVGYNTFSTTYAPGNPDDGEMTLPAHLFKKGNNIIAVEVHNNSGSSSDIYWDANLYYNSTLIDGDFYATDTEIDLPSQNFNLMAYYEKKSDSQLHAEGITPIRINEVSADNGAYINDYFKKADWIELYNTTDQAIDIAGMYLSDKESDPHKFQITGGDHGASTVIPAYGHLLVWCDKQPTANELHADFKLANDGGTVTLTAADDSWTDKMPYPSHDGNSTVGRYPDGGNDIYVLSTPTIRKPNMLSTYAELYMSTTEGISDIYAHADRNVSLRYAGDWLTITAKGQQRANISIYTVQGQLVYTTTAELHDGYAQIPVGSLGRGCFIAKATTESRQSSTCKFIGGSY